MYPKDIIERIKLPFRKDKELYSSFYKILGFYPHHIQYYEQALHHKSSSIKKQGSWINNERLEFLGDAILDAVVGDIVFRHFKGKREGFLTNTRSKIVQRETLNRLAVEIGLDKLIISSTHSSTHNSYMCGNAFEAMVGAIYLDRGYIVDKLGVDEAEVVATASFTNDLGADSLDTVELIMEFEKEFGINIPDDQAEKITTVGDAISYIEANAK